jgi:ubiquinone biosynthesis protein COQ9
VVTNVEEKPEAYVEPKSGAPTVKNLAELQEWVTSQMWRKDSVSETLQDAGFASSAAYLQKPGNTVQGLAELLHERLSW